MKKTVTKPNPIRFAPVLVVCLGLIIFGLYKTFHQVFDVRSVVVNNFYHNSLSNPTDQEKIASPSAKVLPTAANSGKKIISAILNTECKIEIKTEAKVYKISTEGLSGDCKNEAIGLIPPSEEYLVFPGTLGKSENLIKIFVPAYEKTITLGSWKDGEIKDFIFVPKETLIVLTKLPNKISLDAFELSLFTREFAEIYNPKTGYVDLGKKHGRIYLDVKNGEALKLDQGRIQIISSDKSVQSVIKPQNIIRESILTTISPAEAEVMALKFYEDTEKQKGVSAKFELIGSTDSEWKIIIVNTEDIVVKQYMVDNSTGQIK